ncbi:MAG: H-NS histone family protein [Rubrivivax sp.]
MSKSYIQIMKQIEALKGEAEKLRKEEIDGVKARIREAIEFYDLTAADLGLGSAKGGKRKATVTPNDAASKARKPRRARKLSQAAKYRDEATGGTWVGRGKRPQWLRDALTSGKTLDSFLVK